jgi:hypothetical protein
LLAMAERFDTEPLGLTEASEVRFGDGLRFGKRPQTRRDGGLFGSLETNDHAFSIAVNRGNRGL